MSESLPWLATITYTSGEHVTERFATRHEAETFVLAAHKRDDKITAHAITTTPETSPDRGKGDSCDYRLAMPE